MRGEGRGCGSKSKIKGQTRVKDIMKELSIFQEFENLAFSSFGRRNGEKRRIFEFLKKGHLRVFSNKFFSLNLAKID